MTHVGLFLDRHKVLGATAPEIAAAHELDLAVQDQYGVRYVTYWFDEDEGSVFCLAEGPDREAVETVHREAHGLMADNLIEVGEGPINAFLGDLPRHPPGEAYTDSAVRAILFTDFCGSTQLTQELGDEGFMCLLRVHDEIVRSALQRHGGSEVKHTGDGIMASFAQASAALRCALAIHAGFDERRTAGATPDLRVRVGLAAGEPVDHADDMFGATVNLASRICDAAEPGHALVSELVHDLGLERGFSFGPRRDREFRGFQGTTAVFELLGLPPAGRGRRATTQERA